VTAPPPPPSPAARTSASLGAYAAAGGLIALIGWFANVPRLTDWFAFGVSQMPNNAVAMLAAGASVILWSRGKQTLSKALGAFVALIGGATVFEHITSINLGIDTLLLFHEFGQRGTVAPGRMGVPGSVTLTIIGTALALRRPNFVITSGLLTIGIAMLSLIGIVFGADLLYTIPRLTTIALQTTTMILALGAALVASVPDRKPMTLLRGDGAAALLVRRALPVIVLMPLVLGWLRLQGQLRGLFDTAFGTSLLVFTLIGLLAALLWSSAAAVAVHEAAMRENRDRLAGILGSITDAFMTFDANWRFVFVNEETERRLGRTRSELIGRTLWEVYPAGEGHELHTQLHRAMNERRSIEYEVFHPAWQRWMADRAYPTADGGLAVYSRDITERKKAEGALRESEQKFLLLFEKAAFGAAVAKIPDGTFVDVNEGFEKMFGYTREEVVGRTARELGINPDQPMREEALQLLLRDGYVRDLEVNLRTRTGEERTFVNNLTTIELGGEPHLLATLQDITERKLAEESLRASAEALKLADRMKDEFLATLSHELRTPLTAIIGWSQLLLDGGLDPRDQRIALEAIRSSARAQAQLTEDVLDVSRIITGKVRLQRHPSDLAAVIENAVAAVRPAAEAKAIPLRLALDRELPAHFVDPERIQQIVWNLLANAIKFSPPSTVVEVALHRAGDETVIEVVDHGPGIPRDFLPHVFERFRQADSSSSRTYAGLGIGLALAKDLVELHGGTIDVESEEGRGSRFTVRLPRPSAEHPEQTVLPLAAAASAPRALLDGIRVLYVDDREDARVLISAMLKQHGADVIPVESVDDALTALGRESLHVIVTDLAMPKRDGYDLLATVRSDTRWDHLPVLALTAQGRVDDETRAENAGFKAFLRKPIEPKELAAAVARAAADR
jgi:PAS domain S-box-containing protein